MSQLMRRELEQQKAGNALSRWLNRPWVLLPLFLLCVSVIVWRLWPETNPSAEWLIEHSELPQIFGQQPIRSELVWLLVQLDKDYTQSGPDAPWPRWYAERITAHLGAANE